MLTQLPASIANRTYFYAYIAARSQAGLGLLSHWLKHYTSLGVSLSRSGCIVLDTSNTTSRQLNTTRALLSSYGIAHFEVSGYSSEFKAARANAFMDTLPDPTRALLIYPDADEFFQYPCKLEEMLATGRPLPPALVANVEDRVADDYSLRQVDQYVPLATQFPRRCHFSDFFEKRHTGSIHFMKNILVHVADEAGQPVRYTSSHTLMWANNTRASGLNSAQIPPVDHYRYTADTVKTIWRKLARYSNVAETDRRLRVLDLNTRFGAHHNHNVQVVDNIRRQKYRHELKAFERRGGHGLWYVAKKWQGVGACVSEHERAG